MAWGRGEGGVGGRVGGGGQGLAKAKTNKWQTLLRFCPARRQGWGWGWGLGAGVGKGFVLPAGRVRVDTAAILAQGTRCA